MTPDRTDAAEIDALLSGVSAEDTPRMRYLLTGIAGLARGQATLQSEVSTMREVCETRGRLCPGMHANAADPVDAYRLRLSAASTARGVVGTAKSVADETLRTAEGVAVALTESTEEGDMKRAWRITKWALVGSGLVLINQLGNHFFGK